MIPNHSFYLFMNKLVTNIARGSKKDIVLCIAICITRIIIIPIINIILNLFNYTNNIINIIIIVLFKY